MSFLIDTDTCSAHLKQKSPISNRFLQYTGGIHVSTVTLAELFAWAMRATAPPKRLEGVRELLDDVKVLDVTGEVAEAYGRLQAGLLDIGRPAPGMDLLIAATALVHDLTLVTHNTKDYADVPGLRVIDWLVPLSAQGEGSGGSDVKHHSARPADILGRGERSDADHADLAAPGVRCFAGARRPLRVGGTLTGTATRGTKRGPDRRITRTLRRRWAHHEGLRNICDSGRAGAGTRRWRPVRTRHPRRRDHHPLERRPRSDPFRNAAARRPPSRRPRHGPQRTADWHPPTGRTL